ncbi:MAG: hypothetical protein DRN19_05320 [Thermoplasmata archaeon]|nr:MAG: hypothetical protein DRN19_05320 [Thermoplasmata archaeon]
MRRRGGIVVIYVDDDLIIHMLGYLEAKHWADAICTHGYPKEDVFELMEYVEERYNIDLKSEVEEILKERR